MAITSIQKFLRAGKPKSSDFIRFLQLFLQGVSLHAAKGAAEDLKRFRADLDAISEGITEDSSSEDILASLSSMNQVLEQHNRRASIFVKAHVREMQNMLAMMSSTIAFLASSSKVGVQQMQDLEGTLEKAGQIEDVRLIRLKLGDCLTTVKKESSRLRADSQSRIQILKEGLQRTTTTLLASAPAGTTSTHSVPDPVTGPEPQMDAKQMIASSMDDLETAVIAIFLIDRFSPYQARFGKQVSDEIVVQMAQHLRQKLPVASPPYHWGGPAFVSLLMNAEANSQATELQIKRITSAKLEKDFDAGGRGVLLPISCSAVLQGITAGDSAEAVFQMIDKVVASHGAEPAGESR